jgi:maltose/maltodextrin transport system substrate-binding protein
MDSDRGYALAPAAKKFETEFGIKVTIESPEKITDSFSIAAQSGKGPDIVIWAHDKLGEWADGGLIAPLELSKEFLNEFCPRLGRLCFTMIGFGDIQSRLKPKP